MHRKPLEIEAWFQRTTNRKWHMGFQMVTWPMTSRDAQRCCEAVRSAILAIAWLLVLNRLKQGVAKLSPQFVIILFETRCTCTHVGLCTDVCMNGFITIGNLQIAKKWKMHQVTVLTNYQYTHDDKHTNNACAKHNTSHRLDTHNCSPDGLHWIFGSGLSDIRPFITIRYRPIGESTDIIYFSQIFFQVMCCKN